MMDSNDVVLSKHKEHFDNINAELAQALRSRVSLIKDIGGHILLGQGKRLRPLFFVLSCHLCNYRGENIYRLSTVFEYIHAASLLHDDVLDDAELRRRKPSVNHLWGNHAAVLQGDFLSLKSLSIAVSADKLSFLIRLIDTTKQMVEGQIMELIHTGDWHTGKKEYMEIITAKTAALISAAHSCGAIIAGADKEAEQALAKFGLYVGIAFQLIDDLLDYFSSEEVVGKPVGKDLKEGKITLPLIYTLSQLEEAERRQIEDLFRGSQATEKDFQNLIELVRSNGIFDRIRDEAQSYVDEAASCLRPFPDSSTKKELLELSQYIIDRKY